jgi:hypothetical protein
MMLKVVAIAMATKLADVAETTNNDDENATADSTHVYVCLMAMHFYLIDEWDSRSNVSMIDLVVNCPNV